MLTARYQVCSQMHLVVAGLISSVIMTVTLLLARSQVAVSYSSSVAASVISRGIAPEVSRRCVSSSSRRLASIALRGGTDDNGSGKKKVVFLGTPSCAAKSLETLIDNSGARKSDSIYDIVAVVTQPAAAAGRSKKVQNSPVYELAERCGIPILTPDNAKKEDFLAALQSLHKPDLCVTAAYGNFLPTKFLDIPKFGTINIHPSLLPLYRGAAPIQRCLERGDAVTGVSVAFTVLKMDAGPIISQTRRQLEGHEKSSELLMSLFEMGTRELIAALPSVFDGSAKAVPQDDSMATPANKLTASDAKVDFSTMTAIDIHNKVRGYDDWPGTYSIFSLMGRGAAAERGEPFRLKIITSVVLPPTGDAERTNEVKLCKHAGKDVLRVVCADGSALGLLEVQPVAKKIMGAKAYVNGLVNSKADLHWATPGEQD